MLVPTDTDRSSTGTPSVTANLTITSVSEEQARRVSRHPDEWSPEDLYAYVAEECARLNGPQLPGRDARTTIEGFCSRYGIATAVRIARAAYEVYNGMWMGAPVTWRRFGAGHDAFFAEPVLAAMT